MTSPRKQCAKCPWKTSTNPYDIPDGYSREKHVALKSTVGDGSLAGIFDPVRAMACHETTAGKEAPCVGWLVNQLGPGNNIALRFRVMGGTIDPNVKTVGPQHPTLEATLPQRRTR